MPGLSTPGLSAIVLAAGYSSRMGSLKPLEDLGRRTLLARAVGAFAAIGVEDVIVVTGHRGDEVAEAAEALGARAVVNPRYDEGMYSSVKVGAAAVPAGRRFFLLPVDCALVRPETIGRLARAGATGEAKAAGGGVTTEADAAGAGGGAGVPGPEVVLPVYGGLPGHPPLLPPGLRDEIIAGEPAGGLRELLTGRPHPALRVAVDDPGVVYDADTPEDLAAMRAAAAVEELPSERRCLDLLQSTGTPATRVAHSQAVAAVATALAAALNERRQCLCLPLVAAAALLHDVARAQPRHAEVGAELLERLGYPRVARVVRRHMTLGEAAGDDLDEAAVVYFADKLVRGDRVVGVDERFAARFERFAGDPGALAAAQARRDEARRVQTRVEAILGRPVSDLLESSAQSTSTESA